MPGFDKSGPVGQGPMTGRQMGRCTNFGAGRRKETSPENEVQEDNTPPPMPWGGASRGFGRGPGRGGRGRGSGMQNRFRGYGW